MKNQNLHVQICLCLMLTSIFLAAQNVGIGTASPKQKLQIDGKLQIGDDTTTPTNGTIRFNSALNDFEGFTGSKWVSLTRAREFVGPTGLYDYISHGVNSNTDIKTALGNNGDAVIVWRHNNLSSYELFKSERRNGVWTHPQNSQDIFNVTGGNPGAESRPKCAIDSSGNSLIAWIQNSSDGTSQLFFAQYIGGVWNFPTDASDYIGPTSNASDDPAVAMNRSGDGVIVWRQFDGSDYQIFMSEYIDSMWQHPTSLSDNISPNGQSASHPSVAISQNGDAVISWEQSDGLYRRIFYSEKRNGSWSHPASINFSISPNGTDAYRPVVAMDDHGNSVIAWNQTDNSHSQVFMSHYNGSWTFPSGLSDNISPDNVHVTFPVVAMGGHDESVILAKQTGVSSPGVYMSERRNGTWTHPVSTLDVISFLSLISTDPDVSMNQHGETAISWSQYNGVNQYAVLAGTYRNGKWSWPYGFGNRINAVGVSGYNSSISMNGFSDILISWRQTIGTSNVYFAEY